MKLSQYIQELEILLAAHGDLGVVRTGFHGTYPVYHPPTASHMKILGKRESVPRIWQPLDDKVAKGEAVILL